VSFERAHGFAFGLSFAGAALEVGAGALVVDRAVERDRVEGTVGLAVAAAVEAVSARLTWVLVRTAILSWASIRSTR
jgi:UDP-N-acetylmuramyl pentapeptide synthase